MITIQKWTVMQRGDDRLVVYDDAGGLFQCADKSLTHARCATAQQLLNEGWTPVRQARPLPPGAIAGRPTRHDAENIENLLLTLFAIEVGPVERMAAETDLADIHSLDVAALNEAVATHLKGLAVSCSYGAYKKGE
jgi:hypothetical protein